MCKLHAAAYGVAAQRLYNMDSIHRRLKMVSRIKVSGQGRGGGASGRAMAFCPSRPGSNPGLDFGFFQFRIAVDQLLLGVGHFLK